jgi:hypothetical protein
MLRWQTAKHWTYKGRTCEIQQTTVGESTQYRGLVALDTDVSDRALERSPVGEPTRTRRPVPDEDGEFRTWLRVDWSGDGVADLREAVNELADYVREVEV